MAWFWFFLNMFMWLLCELIARDWNKERNRANDLQTALDSEDKDHNLTKAKLRAAEYKLERALKRPRKRNGQFKRGRK